MPGKSVRRLPHWEMLLDGWHKVAETRPFLWGLCHDRASAIRVMRDYAGGGVEKTVAKAFAACGFGDVPPIFARRGDCGLVPGDGGPALAVCLGKMWAAQSKDGLVYLPLKNGLRAWRI